MEEMGVWSEVVRALLPQSCTVRVAWQGAGLIVATPSGESVAWIDRFELRELTPTKAVAVIVERLQRPARCTASVAPEQVPQPASKTSVGWCDTVLTPATSW